MISRNSLYQTLCALKPTDNTPMLIAVVGAGGKTHTIWYLAAQLKDQGCSVCVTTTTKMYFPEHNKADRLVSMTELGKVRKRNNDITFVYKDTIESEDTPLKAKGLTQQETDHLFRADLFDFILIEADGAKGLPLKAPARHEPCIPEQADVVIGVTSAELLLTAAQPECVHRWQVFSELTGCRPGEKIDETVIEKLLARSDGLFKNTPAKAKKIWLINKMDLAPNKQALEQLTERLFNKRPELNAIWLTELNSESPIYRILSRQRHKRQEPK